MDQWNTEGSIFSWGFLQSNKWLRPAPAMPDGAAHGHSSIAGYQQVSCCPAQACHCAGHVWSNCMLIACLLRTATGHSFTPQAVACVSAFRWEPSLSTQYLICSHDWPRPTVSALYTGYSLVREKSDRCYCSFSIRDFRSSLVCLLQIVSGVLLEPLYPCHQTVLDRVLPCSWWHENLG